MATTVIGVRVHRVSLLAPGLTATWKPAFHKHWFSCPSPRDPGSVHLDLPHGDPHSSLTPTTKRHSTFKNSVNTARRYRLLRERLNGGVFSTCATFHSTNLELKIGQMSFCLPRQLCRQWDLLGKPSAKRQIQLNVEASDGPHEHIFATKSIESDAAARIGIRAQFRDLEPVWLKCSAPSAVAFGNALADWLDDETMDLDKHQWGADRYPFIGVLSHIVAKSSWDSTFDDPIKRKAHASMGMATESKWVIRPSALKALANLRERTHDKSGSAIIEYALKHHDQYGYLPTGLFFRRSERGEYLRIELRSDAEENYQSSLQELHQ